jgi:hypothetical protein
MIVPRASDEMVSVHDIVPTLTAFIGRNNPQGPAD